ncbi:hypothetical protein IKQ26_07460 [bacterium]|nr:hypothetical protein [bacterium]
MQISSIPAIGLKSANVQNQMGCQPIKKAQNYEFAMPFKSVHHNQDGDVAELDSEVSLQEKYDFACRLAAYYQQQYENLKLQGNIEA